ncbi:MAG: hypothetical protein D6737_03845 [Chloroflexi bacterium]|nr:MAG: hypothetical protein CUN54_04880 [Phototrophicales bacterium]RMF81813.1 MAG: hypothetical protein D6737_03845 [Chloroflexota bacterium]
MIENIQWQGHGSFVIHEAPLIYINPWRVPRTAFHPDVILIGHDHYDHFSPADVEKLSGSNTIVISNERVAEQLQGCHVLRPWQTITVGRAAIKAVPAYSPTGWQHPLNDGGLGFIISLNFYDIYYAGDTQIIPEMDAIHPDIAMLPIDGNGTLTVDDAVEVTEKMQPGYVYPFNWGNATEGGTLVDARMFERRVKGTTRVILPEFAG